MGDPEGNVGEGSGNGHHSPQGPQMGNLQSGGGVAYLPGTLRNGRRRALRDRASVSAGAL